jgi:UDPglucose 6-dehydrogenase
MTIKIAVIGTGYVGLVSGTCFAELGHSVICIDNNKEKIAQLNRAEIPIYEPHLAEMVSKNIAEGRLNFDNQLQKAVELSQVLFIAVGTPTDPTTGQADLSYLKIAAREIAQTMNEYKVIVVKSTVPVGTCHLVKTIIQQENPNAQFDIVSNPEFLREGLAVYDFMNPDRLVIGIETNSAKAIMNQIYEIFDRRDIPILFTDLESSELIKYAANCFLATKIAFINEIANLCEKTDANIVEVSKGLGLDHRIGLSYLNPSPGFGGSCFPKDTLALAHTAREACSPLTIVESVILSNERHKSYMIEKILTACQGTVQGKTLAVLGVAFKANTDDVRESSALIIIAALQKQGANIIVYDPAAMKNAATVLSKVVFAKDAYQAMHNADAVVIATEWQEFCDLNFHLVGENVTVVDLRNLYDPKAMRAQGIRYFSIGRKPVIASKKPLCVD